MERMHAASSNGSGPDYYNARFMFTTILAQSRGLGRAGDAISLLARPRLRLQSSACSYCRGDAHVFWGHQPCRHPSRWSTAPLPCPRARCSRAMIASSICARSRRNSATILMKSMLEGYRNDPSASHPAVRSEEASDGGKVRSEGSLESYGTDNFNRRLLAPVLD